MGNSRQKGQKRERKKNSFRNQKQTIIRSIKLLRRTPQERNEDKSEKKDNKNEEKDGREDIQKNDGKEEIKMKEEKEAKRREVEGKRSGEREASEVPFSLV